MKKIFAFILATIMVVSLVPASVFAAITNDPGCETVHTVKNCDYTVLGNVDATCTDPSYTAYQCNKCGKQFADNFGTEPAGHKWVDDNNDSDKKYVAVNCATKTDGVNHQKCSVAGCDATQVVKTPWADAHKWSPVSGFGCETVYECTNSGCDATKTEEHEWVFISVEKEPKWENGSYVAGSARFECSECDEFTNVDILDVACTHAKKTLVQAAVKETCEADGSYAIYRCDGCHALFILVGENDYQPIDKIDSPKVVINKIPGHEPKKDTEKTEGCVYSYTCKHCGEKQVNKKHPPEKVEIKEQKPATCTTWGYTSWLCRECGDYDVDPVEPTGHKTEESTKPATCATAGVKYTLCANANCPNNTKVVDKAYQVTKKNVTYKYIVSEQSIPANGEHNFTLTVGEKTYNWADKDKVPGASCDQTVVYIWTCKNCTNIEVDPRIAQGHDTYIAKESHNCGEATKTLKAWTTRYYEYCKNCDYGHDNKVYTDVLNASLVTSFATKEEAELFHGVSFKLIDAEGKVTYDYRDGKDEHTLKFETTIPATCTFAGYTLYTCNDCDALVYVIDNNGGHKPLKYNAEVAPTECKKTGTVGHYICSYCNKAYVEDANGVQTTLTTTKIPAHGYYGNTMTDTNCDAVSYWKCNCGKTFTDKTASESYTKPEDAHKWAYIREGEAATCNLPGTAEVKYCTACNVLEINRLYKNTITGEIVTVKLLKDKEYKLDGTDIAVTLLNGATLPIKGNKTIANNTANATVLIVAKLEHVIPSLDLDETAIVKATESKSKDEEHTIPNYDHNKCTFCDHEYLTNYFPATNGHKNAAGQTLTEDCENASVKDRVCVVCLAAGYNKAESTITIKHNWQKFDDKDYQVVLATCVDEGYSIKYCVDCGTREVYDIKGINPDNHADPQGVVANYAQNGYAKQPCAACGFEGEIDDTMADKKGLELLLSYDVNHGHESDYAALGSIITVYVDLGSLNGVDVWGANFVLNYNANVLDFIEGSEAFSNELGFNIRLATDVKGTSKTSGEVVSYGMINVALQADTQNVEIKGTKNLLVLQFKVIDPFTSTTGEIYITKSDVHFIDENGVEIQNTMWNTTNYVSDKGDIEIKELFELDGVDGMTMGDALEIYKLVLFNEFDARADINADGRVDYTDLDVFYACLTAATNIIDYLFPANPEERPTPKN